MKLLFFSKCKSLLVCFVCLFIFVFCFFYLFILSAFFFVRCFFMIGLKIEDGSRTLELKMSKQKEQSIEICINHQCVCVLMAANIRIWRMQMQCGLENNDDEKEEATEEQNYRHHLPCLKWDKYKSQFVVKLLLKCHEINSTWYMATSSPLSGRWAVWLVEGTGETDIMVQAMCQKNIFITHGTRPCWEW